MEKIIEIFKHRKRGFILAIPALMYLVIPKITFAKSFWDKIWGNSFDHTSKTDILAFLTKHADVLHLQGLLGWLVASIKWALIKGLYTLDVTLQKLIPQAFSMRKILHDAGVSSVTSQVWSSGIIVALMSITLAWFLLKKNLFPNKTPEFKDVITQMLVALFLIMGIPWAIDTGLDISGSMLDTSLNGDKGSIPLQIVSQNTTDILAMTENSWEAGDTITDAPGSDSSSGVTVTTEKNYLTDDNFSNSTVNDLTMTIDKDILGSAAFDGHQVTQDSLAFYRAVDEQGQYNLVPVEKSQVGLINKVKPAGYQRYVTEGLPIFLGLISIGVAFVFTIWSIIYNVLQLVFKKIPAAFAIATDLEDGGRSKKVVQDLMSNVLLIGATAIEFAIYVPALGFITINFTNALLRSLGYVALTMILIAGSEGFLKYLGLDTGLKSTGHGLLRAAAGTAAGFSIASRVGNSVKSNATTVGSGVKTVGETMRHYTRAKTEPGDSRYDTERTPKGIPTDGLNKVKKDAKSTTGEFKNGANNVKDNFNDTKTKAENKNTKSDSTDLNNDSGAESIRGATVSETSESSQSIDSFNDLSSSVPVSGDTKVANASQEKRSIADMDRGTSKVINKGVVNNDQAATKVKPKASNKSSVTAKDSNASSVKKADIKPKIGNGTSFRSSLKNSDKGGK